MAIVYVVTKSHHFFSQIRPISLAIAGMYGTLNLTRAARIYLSVQATNAAYFQMGKLVSEVGKCIELEGKIVNVELTNLADIFESLANNTPLDQLFFGESAQFEPMEPIVRSDVDPGFANSIIQIALGSAFESVVERIDAVHGDDRNKWPRILDYFRHIRNACFHGNHFNIYNPRRGKGGVTLPAIDTANPPRWRGSMMSDDDSMNKRGLMGDWFAAGDGIALLNDVHEQLLSDGIKP